MIVLANNVGRFSFAGVHEEKCGVFAVSRAELLNGWSIAIGDRTVRAHKDQNDHLSLGCSKWIEGLAFKVSRKALNVSRPHRPRAAAKQTARNQQAKHKQTTLKRFGHCVCEREKC